MSRARDLADLGQDKTTIAIRPVVVELEEMVVMEALESSLSATQSNTPLYA